MFGRRPIPQILRGFVNHVCHQKVAPSLLRLSVEPHVRSFCPGRRAAEDSSRIESLFRDLWNDYKSVTPTSDLVCSLFQNIQDLDIVNDHVAFRTFNHPDVELSKLSQHFENLGYEEAGSYVFEEKKLNANHFENPGFPLVFLSELILEDLSAEAQEIIVSAIDQIDNVAKFTDEPSFLTAGRPWQAHLSEYTRLLEESEYAAWTYAFGFRVNHFTVSINHLETMNSIEEVNKFLTDAGIQLNSAGGVVKGTPEIFLEQSSTLADVVEFQFEGGETQMIPSCYYEFAKRYVDPKDGKLFTGFHAKSADKIFESTDARERKRQ